MTSPLGYDIDGRPLRAGDTVMVAVESLRDRYPNPVKVMGPCPRLAGCVEISVPDELGGWHNSEPELLRKLDSDHRPADESFEDMMKTLKGHRAAQRMAGRG